MKFNHLLKFDKFLISRCTSIYFIIYFEIFTVFFLHQTLNLNTDRIGLSGIKSSWKLGMNYLLMLLFYTFRTSKTFSSEISHLSRSETLSCFCKLTFVLEQMKTPRLSDWRLHHEDTIVPVTKYVNIFLSK